MSVQCARWRGGGGGSGGSSSVSGCDGRCWCISTEHGVVVVDFRDGGRGEVGFDLDRWNGSVICDYGRGIRFVVDLCGDGRGEVGAMKRISSVALKDLF